MILTKIALVLDSLIIIALLGFAYYLNSMACWYIALGIFIGDSIILLVRNNA